MNKSERISITRILTDLIKADNIIDVGEMDMYAQMKSKYNIPTDCEK